MLAGENGILSISSMDAAGIRKGIGSTKMM
jgi:hypothetical protein